MDLEKTINLIVDDLRINAMPYENYVYEVKATHQIIRKHLTEQLNLSDAVSSKRFTASDMLNAYIRGFKDADVDESGLGFVKTDVIIEEGLKWLKEYHKLKLLGIADVVGQSENLPNITLKQAIATAKPNLDKITDVDKFLDDIR